MACSDKNSLTREGTGRYNRSLAALSPEFARVDERELKDLLLFAQRYAAHVTYINPENNPEGTWEPFVQSDLSVALATLAAIDPIVLTDYYKSLLKRIRMAVKENQTNHAKLCYKYIFDLVITLVKVIDGQCSRMADESDYQRNIQEIIAVKISRPFLRLLFVKNEHAALLPPSDETDKLAPFPVQHVSVDEQPFFYIDTDSTESLYLTVTETDDLAKIHFIVHHNLFQQQMKAVFAGVAAATAKASVLFGKSLENHRQHKPHMALLLTFFRLFGHAQNELNTYGRKHLDYYYRDLLQLKSRGAEPDSAHLVFDLHAHTANHLLKEGTLFKGGQDKNGHSLVYRLVRDTVLNQGKIGTVHSLNQSARKLYATERSNETSPFLFGSENPSLASIGFAVASNLLFLKGGERTITLTILFKSSIGIAKKRPLGDLVFRTMLTGEKGWLEDRVLGVFSPFQNLLTLSITLDGGKDAIVRYDEKTHQRSMHVSLPLLLVCFDQASSEISFDVLADLQVNSIQLQVDVQGYKDVILSNDIGLLDGSRPFKPFGDLPRRNAGFYIGSDELFQKPLTELTLSMDMPAPFSANYLQRGRWNPVLVTSSGKNHTLKLPGEPIQTTLPVQQHIRGYGSGKRDGYIRLVLESDQYSLSSFMDSLTESFNNTRLMKIPVNTALAGYQGIDDAEKTPDVQREAQKKVTLAGQFEGYRMVRNTTPMPKELILTDFQVNYAATDQVRFSAASQNSMFFHLCPFGYKRITSNKLIGLLPRLTNQGELLIGIKQITAPITLSLLFEVVEGSSNPLKSNGAISWYYLDRDNSWKIFPKERVIDGTVNFTRTGIVTVSFPADATLEGTVMPANMLWMKATVQGATDAVCKLKAITAQAGLVTLVQDENKGVFYTQSRPQGTIVKLVESDVAVKRIQQPANSFGGRAAEPAQEYYNRVSERLRHKQRAITMWDYEHLVMEQFPSIYKVKCINRAGFVTHRGVTEFCENYPGHVTLVTIPDLRRSNHANRLRPFTPIATLVDIADYLKNICSPFVTLHVRNPQFEEIQLAFDVRLRPTLDEAYYVTLLSEDIERFLCPWAFDTAKQISFGGAIQKSTLVKFIDERPYVDTVSSFKMHHLIRDEDNRLRTALYNVDTIVASSARSILVPYADGPVSHHIRVLTTCECE